MLLFCSTEGILQQETKHCSHFEIWDFGLYFNCFYFRGFGQRWEWSKSRDKITIIGSHIYSQDLQQATSLPYCLTLSPDFNTTTVQLILAWNGLVMQDFCLEKKTLHLPKVVQIVGIQLFFIMIMMVSMSGSTPWILISNRNIHASFVAHTVKMDCLSSS